MTENTLSTLGRVALVRRHYQADGGGGRLAWAYASAFRMIASEVSILSETASTWPSDHETRVRSQSLDTAVHRNCSFEQWVMRAKAAHGIELVHSHEWLPGAESIRIGDGLHSAFLEGMCEGLHTLARLRFHPVFHRSKLALERETAEHPSLGYVISPSEMCLEEFRTRYTRPEIKCTVIHNPVRSEFFAPLPDKASRTLHLIFVGSGWRRKGLDRLLLALAHLDRTWHLAVVGTDRHAHWYRHLASRLGIASNISWYGAADPVEAYQWAHVLVLPARYEPSGNVVGEALASGCFVVVSDRTGSKDLLQPDTGVITDCAAETLADALETVGRWKSAPVRCRESVAHLTESYLTVALRGHFLQ
jgi:UDP-glucose:(heptosyl)LPS alpha-1,3-glucosyltransferase